MVLPKTVCLGSFLTFLYVTQSSAFVPYFSSTVRPRIKHVHSTYFGSTTQKHKVRLFSSTSNKYDEMDVEVSPSKLLQDRRSVILSGVFLATASSFTPDVKAAEGESTSFGSSTGPIAVLGAGGKCGKLCCEILSKDQLYTRAVTRSGRTILDIPSEYVSYASADVTDYSSIKEAVKGCSGVIFAASASGKKKGGDPEHVDFLGVYNTAKACLECDVPKLVVISAGSVTRPDFVGFKATNFFVKYVYGDNIMDAKIAGESAMRDLYASSDKKSKCAYCVVRPGGLADGAPDGPSQIHVSQGDYYSAEISRADVAEISVAALLKPSTDFTTFELNKVKGLNAVSKELPVPPDTLTHTGKSRYADLLDGLLTDDDMKMKYPVYINNFRGNGLRPLSAIV